MTIRLKDIENKIAERVKAKEPCLKHKGQRCIGYPFRECEPCIRGILEAENDKSN